MVDILVKIGFIEHIGGCDSLRRIQLLNEVQWNPDTPWVRGGSYRWLSAAYLQSSDLKKSSRCFKGEHQSHVLKVGEIPSCLWAVIQALRLCPWSLLPILVLRLWYLIPGSVISTLCSQVFPLNNTPFRKRYVFELSTGTLFWQKIPLRRFENIR